MVANCPIDPALRKSEHYYDAAGLDLVEWLGGYHVRVLDVGCGPGDDADWLRRHGAAEIVGIEPDGRAASVAAMRYDRVINSTVEAALSELVGPFDLIVCSDVLEHLVDPWTVLRGLRHVVAEEGCLAVGLPNIRYYRALMRIAFGAGFKPEEWGTFDSTHLRFFTRANLRDLLRSTGWEPVRWGYPRYSPAGLIRSVLGKITFGVTDEWLASKWLVEAHPSGAKPRR